MACPSASCLLKIGLLQCQISIPISTNLRTLLAGPEVDISPGGIVSGPTI
jgi:hypothetical protein